MNSDLSQFLESIKAKGVSVTLNPERHKRPYRCPVCSGAGNVPAGTYDATTTSISKVCCKSCGGSGVLWG